MGKCHQSEPVFGRTHLKNTLIMKHKLLSASLGFIASSTVQSRYSIFNCEENRLRPFTDLQVGDYILSSEMNTDHVELMKCLRVTKLVNKVEEKSKTNEAQDKWEFDLENGSSFSMDLNDLEERSVTCENSESGENLCGGMSGSTELSEKARKCADGDFDPTFDCPRIYAQWPANQISKSKSSCNRRRNLRRNCSRGNQGYTQKISRQGPQRRQQYPRRRQHNQNNRKQHYQQPRQCDPNSRTIQEAGAKSNKVICNGGWCYTSRFTLNQYDCSWSIDPDTSYPDPNARNSSDDYPDYGYTGATSRSSPCSGCGHGKTNIYVNDDDYQQNDNNNYGGGSMGAVACGKKKHAF